MNCGAGRRCGLDPVSLWLWCRLEATPPIRPLAWEPPYAADVVLEKTKKKKERKEKKKATDTILKKKKSLIIIQK